ncbi:regulatory protein GemA [Pasteurella langaaensis]|uniref:regulatory protein GemA n=1 Tax=Alitibacter langaaensis TaxID=756 RepID=UPI001FAFB6AA|nr:regulatory protein GemA [Pasteurella langaaensis]
MTNKGAKIRLPRGKSSLSPIQRKLWAVWKQMHADGLIDDGSSRGLNGFVKRSLNDDVPWNELTNTQATLILETLKQWQKRVGK